MADPRLEAFRRETIAQMVNRLSLEQRLAGLTLEEHLAGLTADEIYDALTPELRAAVLRRIEANRRSANPE